MKTARFVGASAVLLLMAIYCVTFTDSCSFPRGWKPPTTIQRLGRAEVILYGKVKQTYPDRRISGFYTAEMEVYCILRGQRTSRFVNITNAGHHGGLCTSTELLKEGVYLVPVSPVNGGGDSTLQANTEAGESIKAPHEIEEAMKICNLNKRRTYPRGVRATCAEVKCPAGLPDGNCKNE